MAKPPQPEPISATVIPGFSCNLLVAWISLLRCALFESVMLGIAKISAGILHLIVEEQTVKFSRDIVMMAGMGGGKPDRIGLMPAAQAAPHPPHQLL